MAHDFLVVHTRLLSTIATAFVALSFTSAAGLALERDLPTAACDAAAGGGVPNQLRQMIARGFNLPGWTDEWPPRAPDEKLLAHLRTVGLTHVRLPIRAEMLSERFASSPIVATQSLRQIDLAVSTLLRLNYAVSIDMHSGDGFGALMAKRPNEALAALKEVWTTIAARYSSTPPDRVLFEVLNEPDVPAGSWNTQGPEVVRAIRKMAPEHTIVFGPAFYQRYEALTALTPLRESNIVYAFHYYDPMAFTHQGTTWSEGPLAHVRGVPFPAGLADVEPEMMRLRREGYTSSVQELRKQFSEPWDSARIGRAFEEVAQWMVRYRRPVIVNEFGVLSYAAAPTSRASWIRAVRQNAERFCVGWTHWEYADGFGFVRRKNGVETLDPVIGSALIDAHQ